MKMYSPKPKIVPSFGRFVYDFCCWISILQEEEEPKESLDWAGVREARREDSRKGETKKLR